MHTTHRVSRSHTTWKESTHAQFHVYILGLHKMAAASERSKVPILYCLVARSEVVLCDYILRSNSNLYSVAQDGLSQFQKSYSVGPTIVVGEYELHALRDQDFMFLCITNPISASQKPSVFNMLNRVKQQFDQMELRPRGHVSQAYELRQDFAHVLKGLMEECTYGDSKVRDLATKTHAVKDQMVQNIQRMQERGERLDELSESTELLNRSAIEFKRGSSQLQRKLFWRHCRLCCILTTIIIVILVVLLAAIVIPVAVTQSSHSSKA